MILSSCHWTFSTQTSHHHNTDETQQHTHTHGSAYPEGRFARQVFAEGIKRQDLCGDSLKRLLKHHFFHQRTSSWIESETSLLCSAYARDDEQLYRPLKSSSLMKESIRRLKVKSSGNMPNWTCGQINRHESEFPNMRMIMKNTLLKVHYRIWVSRYENDYEKYFIKSAL